MTTSTSKCGVGGSPLQSAFAVCAATIYDRTKRVLVQTYKHQSLIHIWMSYYVTSARRKSLAVATLQSLKAVAASLLILWIPQPCYNLLWPCIYDVYTMRTI